AQTAGSMLVEGSRSHGGQQSWGAAENQRLAVGGPAVAHVAAIGRLAGQQSRLLWSGGGVDNVDLSVPAGERDAGTIGVPAEVRIERAAVAEDFEPRSAAPDIDDGHFFTAASAPPLEADLLRVGRPL